VTDLRIITDKVTGVSKGYAFVTMSNQEEVAAAIRGGNG
jgi:RNA recognition motif-containing protein